MKSRNKKIPTNCLICNEPVAPNKNGLYNLTCNLEHRKELISRNASKNVKEGKVNIWKGRSF